MKKSKQVLLIVVILIICSSIYYWCSHRRKCQIPVWFSINSGYMVEEGTLDEQEIISIFKKHESAFDQLLLMYFHDKNEYSPLCIHYCSYQTSYFGKRSYCKEIYEIVENAPLLHESEQIKIIDGYMSKIIFENRNKKIKLNERKVMDYFIDQGLVCSNILDIYISSSDHLSGYEEEPQIKIDIYADEGKEISIVYQPNYEFEINAGVDSREEYYLLKKVICLDEDWYFLYKEANENINILY